MRNYKWVFNVCLFFLLVALMLPAEGRNKVGRLIYKHDLTVVAPHSGCGDVDFESNIKADPFGPKLYYFLIDKTILMRDYKSNSAMLDALDQLLTDPKISPHIDSIIVMAYASPIASRKYNQKLSRDRAQALSDYISWKHPSFTSFVEKKPMGIDWDGFWAIVENTPDMPSRNEILELRKNSEESFILKQLRVIGGHATQKYLIQKVFPKLQYASVRVVLDNGQSISAAGESPLKQAIDRVIYDTVRVEKIVYDTVRLEVPVRRDTLIVEKIIRDTLVIDKSTRDTIPFAVKSDSDRLFYIAVKNNLIYDLGLIPNLAVEIPFGEGYRWSIEVEGHWAWWNSGAPGHWYHRVQSVGGELRRWFANRTDNPLNGWYVGFYGFGGTYDFRLLSKDVDDVGQLSDMSYSVGLSVGYAKPLTKRLNLEFGLAVGYLGGEYKKYDLSACDGSQYPWISTHKRQFFGPTKAKISLVWLIGSGKNKNFNSYKSGRR